MRDMASISIHMHSQRKLNERRTVFEILKSAGNSPG